MPGPGWMLCLCLAACVLQRAASEAQTNITAKPGDVITLPCRAPGSTEILAVNWIRPDLDPEDVFVYRDGRFDPDDQNPAFKERVELKDAQMKNRNVSVTLKDVRVNDTGTYNCTVRVQGQTNEPELISIVHLRVSAAQRNITAKPGDNITLPCRAPGSTKILAVDWIRPDLDPEDVFVYRDRRFDPVNQHPAFKERVELKDSQMKDRDVSVTLKNVRVNDTGSYECRVLQGQTKHRKRGALKTEPISIVHLRVSAGHNEGGRVGLAVGLTVGVLLLVAGGK